MRVSIAAFVIVYAVVGASVPLLAQGGRRPDVPKLEEASAAAQAAFEAAEAALRSKYDALSDAVAAERARAGATWIAELGRVLEPLALSLARDVAPKKGAGRATAAAALVKRDAQASLAKIEVAALKAAEPYVAARLTALGARADLPNEAYETKAFATLVLEELLSARPFHEIWNESLAPILPEAEAYRKALRAAHEAKWDLDVAKDPVLLFRRGAPEGFARITAGSYPKVSAFGKESPRPKQTVVVPNDVFVGLYEVTHAEYFAWWSGLDADSKNRHAPRADDAKKTPLWTTPEGGQGPEPTEEQRPLPVVGVTLPSAVAYATALGARLPTEAEWCAAAGGRDGLKFPWGQEWKPNCANDADAGLGKPSEPGKFPLGRGPFGHFDLSGNVDEWTATYSNGKDVDFAKLDADLLVIVRGGSFNLAKDDVSNHWSWHRRASFDSSVATGFRLAMDAAAARKK
jgi:formylglycine-generating enzyme required for sulfatase activity